MCSEMWMAPSISSQVAEPAFFESSLESLAELQYLSPAQLAALSPSHRLSSGHSMRMFHVKQPMSGEFFGRESELMRLAMWQRQYAFQRQQGLPGFFSLICGAHGSGKSELARQFAQQHSRKFDAVFWVPTTESEFGLLSHFAVIAHAQLPAAAATAVDPLQAARALAEWLSQPGRDWLLVLDEYDLPPASKLLRLLIGERPNGMVIVIPSLLRCHELIHLQTVVSPVGLSSGLEAHPEPLSIENLESTTSTTSSSSSSSSSSISALSTSAREEDESSNLMEVAPEFVMHLDGFGEKDGIRFLSQRSRRLDWMRDGSVSREVRLKDRGYARQIVEETSGLPESLLQIASYIRKTGSTFSNYYSLFFRTRNQMRSSQSRAQSANETRQVGAGEDSHAGEEGGAAEPHTFAGVEVYDPVRRRRPAPPKRGAASDPERGLAALPGAMRVAGPGADIRAGKHDRLG
ncbi:MAG: ATP-binding protein, partial [archaeon]|nr:ATP-binding protein [archaeon]